MDYIFIGDRSSNQDEDKPEEETGEEHELNDKDVAKANILVIKDVKSQVCAAIPAFARASYPSAGFAVSGVTAARLKSKLPHEAAAWLLPTLDSRRN